MANEVRIEIVSRNEFWRNAFFVEWKHQFPEREMVADSHTFYLVPEDWLPDLERVAAQCFSRVLLAPRDPARRRLFRLFLPGDGEE